MSDTKKIRIERLVYTFARICKVKDNNKVIKLIDKLTNMKMEEVVDYVLISLNDKAKEGVITKEDIFDNIFVILNLYPKKYKTKEDLEKRLNELLGMNVTNSSSMSLIDNHRAIINTFMEFNKLIQAKLDCFYTGGSMGYIATNHELERYHNDLDLLVNEKDIDELKRIVRQSDDFSLFNIVRDKKENGHEFKITSKKNDMSIGIFLFERTEDQSIIINSYYYKDNVLMVDKEYLDKEFSNLAFPNYIREYKGTLYKMCSLEHIYNLKMTGDREKDLYDTSIVKDYVNMNIVRKLDKASSLNKISKGNIVSKNNIFEAKSIIIEKR